MYHVSRNGQQTGPFTEEQVRQMAATGQITRHDLVWKQGDSNWVPAGQVPGLFPMPQNLYGPPGAPAYQPGAIGSIPNYLVQSILVTVLCCLPFGIPAIVYSSQVNSKLMMGDIAGAKMSSDKAKFWGWMSFGFGLGVAVLYFIAIVGGAVQMQ